MGLANISGNILTDTGASLSSYLPLTGGTLTGALNGTSATFSSSVTAGGNIQVSKASPSLLLYNATTSQGAYALNVNTSSVFSITNDYAGTTPFVINSSGNVGIGTISPQSYTNYRILHIAGPATNGSGLLYLTNSDNSIVGLAFAEGSASRVTFGSQTNHPVTFVSNDTERMRITSGGAVGIKITPSSGWGSVMSALQIGTGGVINNYTGANNNMGLGVNFYDNGAGSQLRLYTGGVSNMSFNEDVITFSNAGSNSAGTTISYTERMRITSGGYVGINVTNPQRYLEVYSATADNHIRLSGNAPSVSMGEAVTGSVFQAKFGLATSSNQFVTGSVGGDFVISNQTGAIIFVRNTTESMRVTSNGYVLIGYSSAPSAAGLLQTTSAYVGSLGTGIVYSLSGVLTSTNPSDLRLKDNVEDLGYGLKEILQLRPVKYNWKNDNANQGKQFGFIAQEVQDVMPELVSTFDTEDGERLGLEKEGIYAALVQAIKELKAEIDELKNK